MDGCGGGKRSRKLRLDDIRKKIVNRVNAQNKKEITEKLSDIFGEKNAELFNYLGQKSMFKKN